MDEENIVVICTNNIDYVLKEVENEYNTSHSWNILKKFIYKHLGKEQQ